MHSKHRAVAITKCGEAAWGRSSWSPVLVNNRRPRPGAVDINVCPGLHQLLHHLHHHPRHAPVWTPADKHLYSPHHTTPHHTTPLFAAKLPYTTLRTCAARPIRDSPPSRLVARAPSHPAWCSSPESRINAPEPIRSSGTVISGSTWHRSKRLARWKYITNSC
jgi:hypothetical protein